MDNELQSGQEQVSVRLVPKQNRSEKSSLEEEFRLEQQQRQKVLRSNIVHEKKVELSRTLHDVESQLNEIRAMNQARLDEQQQLLDSEKSVFEHLKKLESDLVRLKTDDDWMEGDDLVSVNSDIESIRRSLLTVQMKNSSAGGTYGRESVSGSFDFNSISFLQAFKFGLGLMLPVSVAIVIAGIIVAISILSVF